MALRFVDDELEEQIRWLDWRLRDMILPEVVEHAEAHGYWCYVTSVVRDDGVHGAKSPSGYRAVDVDPVPQDLSVSQVEADAFGESTAVWVNKRYDYGRGWDGKKREVALWHENRGSEGFHLHLQCPAHALRVHAVDPRMEEERT